jgi:hypothetical protein
LLENAGYEADSPREAVKPRYDDLGVITSRKLDGFLKLNAGVVSTGSYVGEFGDQGTGARDEISDLALLGCQAKARLALAHRGDPVIGDE